MDKPYFPQTILRKLPDFPEKTLRTNFEKSLNFAKPYTIQTLYLSNWVYNVIMTRNHFSKKGGPYFVNDGFPKYEIVKPNKGLDSVSLIGKIRSLFKFPRSKPAK